MNINDIDLNLLRVFDAVLRQRNVTAAAARLGLTQPAVSNALARLRRMLDDALFVRTPDGMHPTPFAQGLGAPVRQALALVETALALQVGFDPATSTRTFHMHLSDVGEMVFLPRLLECLQRVAPGVRVEAAGYGLAEITNGLADGSLDLAMGALPGLAGQVQMRVLLRDPYVCLMRAGHPLARERLTLRKFAEVPIALVSSQGGGHRVVEEMLTKLGLTKNIALRVPHYTVVPLVLERTDLVLTIPEQVARAYEQDRRCKSVKPPFTIPPVDVGIYWHERFERDPGNKWLRDLLVELFDQLTPAGSRFS